MDRLLGIKLFKLLMNFFLESFISEIAVAHSRHRRHDFAASTTWKNQKGNLGDGWRRSLHDLTRISSALLPRWPECNDLRNCALICDIEGKRGSRSTPSCIGLY